ncbi:MAG: hypothetical protein K8F91_05325, partial [Candidatus Obscuribacterales bacterium]|nr:hypothetical protein [Candidatus Obscuribacterales bacterium]
GIASAINSDTDCQSVAVSASSSGTVVTIESNSIYPTSYRATTSSFATETAIVGLPQNGVQTAVIGGTITTSDVVTVTVHDQGLTGGSKAASHTVLVSDTPTIIAAALATVINADTDLQAIGVTATSSDTVLNIKSASVNATTYTSSVTGSATETVTLAPSTGITKFTYDDVNAITSIAAGGAALFQGGANKALESAEVDSSAVPLDWSQSFAGNATLSTGNNNIPVEVTDGASNTKNANH